MINAMLSGFLKFLASVITLLLTPLNLLLEQYVPQTTIAFGYIEGFWELLNRYSGFVMSYTGLTSEVISICVILFVAIINIPFVVHGIKLIAKWWEVLV